MAAEERDQTGEWQLPAGGGIPTLYDLEQRVEVAITIARAAETAALEIGAASIEAAQQARRAAELAEKASLAAVAGGAVPVAGGHGVAVVREPPPRPIALAPAPQTFAPPPEPEPAQDPFQERLLAFRERAERVSVRLRRLDGAAPISSS